MWNHPYSTKDSTFFHFGDVAEIYVISTYLNASKNGQYIQNNK
jgi:hypothetical protein